MIQSIIILICSTALLSILFKFKGATQEELDLTQLKNEFRDLDLKLVLGFFLLIPMNNAFLAYLLTLLSNIGFSSEPHSQFIIRPTGGTWFILSTMFSLVTSFIIVIFLVKRFKKDQAQKYWKYYNLKYGFNVSGLLKYLFILITLFATLITMSQMNSYVKFRTDSIVINKSLDFKDRTYGLGDISEINHYEKTTTSKGKIVEKPHYRIVFKDGFAWRTNDDFRTPKIKDDVIVSNYQTWSNTSDNL